MSYEKPRHVYGMALLNSTVKEQRNPAAYALVASIKESIKSSVFRKSTQHGKLFDWGPSIKLCNDTIFFKQKSRDELDDAYLLRETNLVNI